MAESLSACRRHFLSRRIHRGPVSCFVATRFLAPYPAWSRSNRSPVRSPGRRAASMATSRVGGADGVVVKAPSGSTKSTVIFLHGLGDTARGWTDAFPLEGLPSTRYVLPTAEVMPVSLNMGFRMPSWFDLYGLDGDAPDDSEGIGRAVGRVNKIIEDEVSSGIPTERIIVGGFSQGGAVALIAGLRSTHKLGGIVALSSWLPMRKEFQNSSPGLSSLAKETPVLMCGGDMDNVVNPLFQSGSAKVLRDLGVDVDFRTYPGLAHSANVSELSDFAKFVKQVLPQT